MTLQMDQLGNRPHHHRPRLAEHQQKQHHSKGPKDNEEEKLQAGEGAADGCLGRGDIHLDRMEAGQRDEFGGMDGNGIISPCHR